MGRGWAAPEVFLGDAGLFFALSFSCPPGICSMSQPVLWAEACPGMDTDAQVLFLGKE